MDKLLFNAICDLTTDRMNEYLTDAALIEFAEMANGDSETSEYYAVCWDEATDITWKQLYSDGRECILSLIRRWRKEGRLKPFII